MSLARVVCCVCTCVRVAVGDLHTVVCCIAAAARTHAHIGRRKRGDEAAKRRVVLETRDVRLFFKN